jgi:hypothetical protein
MLTIVFIVAIAATLVIGFNAMGQDSGYTDENFGEVAI